MFGVGPGFTWGLSELGDAIELLSKQETIYFTGRFEELSEVNQAII